MTAILDCQYATKESHANVGGWGYTDHNLFAMSALGSNEFCTRDGRGLALYSLSHQREMYTRIGLKHSGHPRQDVLLSG